MLHDLCRIHLQGVCAHEGIQHEAQVFGDAINCLWSKNACFPSAVVVFGNEIAAIAPDPGRKIVRNVPVALARERECANFGSVFECFVAVVHLADGAHEAVECRYVFGLDIVLFKNALVCKNRADVDEPRDGIDRRIGVDAG